MNKIWHCMKFATAMTCLLLFVGSTRADEHALATQLNAHNIAALQPRGPDAIAGLGDWVLGNGTLCAAISDLEHESGFNPWGGSLIDVYHCGRKNDQWPFQHALPNLDKDKPLQPVEISVVQEKNQAAILVLSKGDGLTLRSRYQLSTENPTQLQIDHELIRVNEGTPVTMFGVLMLHPHLALTPYSISTIEPQYSWGFSHPSVDRSDTGSQLNAMIPGDLHVMVGSAPLSEVSYGIHLTEAELLEEDGNAVPLPIFQQTDPTYSIQGVLSREPWLGGSGKLGYLEFAQSQLMDIRIGETLRLQQIIYLGDKADVASITNQIYQGPTITGSVNPPNSMVHIRDHQGLPLTTVRVTTDGSYRARLPLHTSTISLVAHTPWGISDGVRADALNEVTTLPAISLQAPSYIHIPHGEPMRLIFEGLDGTPDPDFNNNLMAFSLNGEPLAEVQTSNYLSFGGVESDVSKVALPPGKYRVLATRGMAFGITETEISIAAGEELLLDIDTPMRELANKEWLGSDFHVHSAPSFDSYIPIDERLRGYAAQGSDVLVATEHNVLIDYSGYVERLGLNSRLKVISGLELTGMARTETTPYTNGHLNIFPLEADPQAFAGGLMPHEGRRLHSLYREIGSDQKRIFQLNHPRLSDPLDIENDNAYFEHLLDGPAYNPDSSLESDDNRSLIEPDPVSGLRDIDFDILEIANGGDFEAYKIARSDWFSLLNKGERILGSANSDSHGSQQLVAIPQNYIKLNEPYRENAFIEAVHRGRMIGTSGPLLEVWASTPENERLELGETVSRKDFSLHVSIRAASWVPVAKLRVYLNGLVYHQQPVKSGEQLEIPVTTDREGYVVVEVTGEADELYSTIAPGFTPFAFTNPIYVDP